MWADCYRTEVPGRMNITTTNGVETINRVIKHDVLTPALMKGKVSVVLAKLIDEYLLDVVLKFNQNVRSQNQAFS